MSAGLTGADMHAADTPPKTRKLSGSVDWSRICCGCDRRQGASAVCLLWAGDLAAMTTPEHNVSRRLGA